MEALFDLLREAVSPCHTVQAAERRLAASGFLPLSMSEVWSLAPMGRYYVRHRDSSLFAFTVGEDVKRDVPVRITAAHTDFPALSIKANPQMEKKGYLQLNVEEYGGTILNTWLDRPLGAAGKAALRSENPMKPEIRLVDIREPFCTIPNLAIHMDREINKGAALNRQTHMLPVAGLADGPEKKDRFLQFLAEHLQTKPEDILDFELYLYSPEEAVYTGMDREFISSPHLDNVTSVTAALRGITGETCAHGINVMAMFDHEEIGSRTAKGAGNIQLLNLLKKLLRSLPQPESEDLLYESMLLSLDVAHGVHPNHTDKADPVLAPVLGGGFCIKEACAQSYATDSRAIAALQQICDAKGIPYQKYANRSDIRGGSTIGNILSVFLPVSIVDIGVPILAMHSVRELMGAADMEALSKCIEAFYIA